MSQTIVRIGLNWFFIHFYIADSLMGSDCEEEDEDDDPIRPPLNLGHLSSNGPESVGHLGTSDLSVQSMSTDSKNNDDSDQVNNFDSSFW
jgi:hypothetical protein